MDTSLEQSSFEAAVNLNALQRAPSRLYDESLSAGSGLARLVRARFNSVPGTSCGLMSLSKDLCDRTSLPYLTFAARIACRISAFFGEVKYITTFPLSARRPKAESSSVW